MDYIKISLGIFFALAVSRFVPHPPNFTSVLALSFYIPGIFGARFIPSLLASFIITDIIIGLHPFTPFTWGSVIFISIFSKFFIFNFLLRILGALIGAIIFFIVTNFGVWSMGGYGFDINGLIICYTVALPFFGNSLISTLIFSCLIEILLKSFFLKKKFFLNT